MFRDEYRRLNDAVHPDEALIRRTLERASQPRSPRSALPLLTAVVCMLVLLILPGLLRTSAPDVTTQTSASTTPGMQTIDASQLLIDGMTLRCIGSQHHAGSTYLLLSLEGEGISEEMRLTFAVTSEMTGQTFAFDAFQIDHDPQVRRSTFLLEIHDITRGDMSPCEPLEWNGGRWQPLSAAWDPTQFQPLPAVDQLTLTLLSYRHILYLPLNDTLPLSSLPDDPPTRLVTAEYVMNLPVTDPLWQELYQQADGYSRFLEEPKKVLTACEPLGTPYDGFHIVAAGFDGDALCVQTCTEEAYAYANDADNRGLWLYLIPLELMDRPWQYIGLFDGILSPITQYIWHDEALGGLCIDYRYRISREELLTAAQSGGGWQLCAYGYHERIPDAFDQTLEIAVRP